MKKLCPACSGECFVDADVCKSCGHGFEDPGHAQMLTASEFTWLEWLFAKLRGRDAYYVPPPNRTAAGKIGTVTQGWDGSKEQTGRVIVSGERWTARSRWREDVLEKGDEVRVTGREGLTLVVEKATDSGRKPS